MTGGDQPPEPTAAQVLAVLQNVQSQLNNQQQQARKERAEHQKELQELRNILKAREEQPVPEAPVPLPAAPLALPPGQAKKRAILPDVARFDGTRKQFPNWLLEMKGKLEVDGDAIPGDAAQFYYIYSRLEGVAKSMAGTYAQVGGPGGARSPLLFLNYLSESYGDPNLAQKALNRLRGLKQKNNESFSAFLPKFEKELADSGGNLWPEEVKINYLTGTLNEDLTKLLDAQAATPAEYTAFKTTIHSLGANIDNRRSSERRKNSAVAFQHKGQQQGSKDRGGAHPDAMDWEATKVSQASASNGKRAKWVTKEERDRRFREKCCLRCGKPGCREFKCPYLPARRPDQREETQVRSARKGPRRVLFEELSSQEEDSSSDQTDTSEEEEKE